MTEKQSNDIETRKYFIPICFKHIEITNNDIEMFLENSEKGLHKDKIDKSRRKIDGFHALIEGKKWRGIHVHEMYEQGISSGDVPYSVLVDGMPRVLVNFLKREMFQGSDSGLIERCYNNLTTT